MPDPAAGAAHDRPGTTPVVVRLPGVLVDLFPGSVRRLELQAGTVAEMIDGLDARWPGMRDRLCDSTPAVRRHINVFVDGRRAGLVEMFIEAEITRLFALRNHWLSHTDQPRSYEGAQYSLRRKLSGLDIATFVQG